VITTRRRHPVRPLAAILLSCCLPLAAEAKTEFAALFPQTTVLYAEVADPEALAALRSHPVFKALEPGKLGDVFAAAAGGFFSGVKTKIWEDETVLKLDALRTKFTGAMAAAVFDVKFEDGNISAGLALAAEFSGDDALAAKMAKALLRADADGLKMAHEEAKRQFEEAKKLAAAEGDDPDEAVDPDDPDEPEEPAEESSWLHDLTGDGETTSDHAGATVHVWKMNRDKAEETEAEIDEVAWCVRGGVLLMATGADEMNDMLDRAAGPDTSAGWAASAAYKDALKEAEGADFLIVADAERFMTATKEILASDDVPGEPGAAAVVRALELDKFRRVVVALTSDAAGVNLVFAMTHDSTPAIIRCFKWQKQDPPRIFPDNVRDVTWAPLDVKGMLGELETLADRLAPDWHKLLPVLMAGAGLTLPIDFRKEVLPHLGTGYFQATRSYATTVAEAVEYSEDDTLADVNALNISNPKIEGAVIGIGITDSKTLAPAALAFLKSLEPRGFTSEKREYLGFEIFDVKSAAEDTPSAACVLAGDWLLVSVGRKELLESILARIAKPEGEHLLSRRDVIEGFQTMPGGETGFSYGDLHEAAQVIAYALALYLPEIADADAGESLDSETLLKGFRFPVNGFDKYYFTDTVTRIASRLVPRPE
jgi:hypothetical protein